MATKKPKADTAATPEAEAPVPVPAAEATPDAPAETPAADASGAADVAGQAAEAEGKPADRAEMEGEAEQAEPATEPPVSGASPLHFGGPVVKQDPHPDRVALAAGLHSMPGQGHIALVDDAGDAVDLDAVFDMGDGTRTFAVARQRVYEVFTTFGANTPTHRLIFAPGAHVAFDKIVRLRQAIQAAPVADGGKDLDAKRLANGRKA